MKNGKGTSAVARQREKNKRKSRYWHYKEASLKVESNSAIAPNQIKSKLAENHEVLKVALGCSIRANSANP